MAGEALHIAGGGPQKRERTHPHDCRTPTIAAPRKRIGGCSAARVMSQAEVASSPTELRAETTPKNSPGMKRRRRGWVRRRPWS